MDETGETKRGPGRPRKAEHHEPRRRRREGGSRPTGMMHKLGLSEDALDLKRFKYRWVNDTAGRLFAFTTQDDWNVVSQVDGELKEDTDLGGAVRVVVGTGERGEPMYAYLCRKPLEWWQADQRQKVESIEEQMNEMRRGNDPDGTRAPGTYVLEGNSL